MYAVHLIVIVYHEKVSLGTRAMVLDVIHSDKSTLYLGPEHKPLSTVRVKISWQTAERIAIFILKFLKDGFTGLIYSDHGIVRY